MQTYLGTWQIAPSDGFWTGQDISESEAVVSAAVRAGIRGFDTARSYGKGKAEQTLSKILRRFPNLPFRVDTKIMPSAKDPAQVVLPSLKALSPLTIDTLYLHWPKSGFDNLGYLEKASELKDKGLIKKLGVCNAPLSMLEEFTGSGLQIDRYQRPVSLLWTRELNETKAFCRGHNIELAAYSPAGMGLLSGKYRSPDDLEDERKNLFCFREPCRRAFLDLLDLIGEIAANNGTEYTDVALSWSKAQNPDIIILGARNTAQLKHNLEHSLILPPSELSDLDSAAFELEKASRDVCDNIFSYRW